MVLGIWHLSTQVFTAQCWMHAIVCQHHKVGVVGSKSHPISGWGAYLNTWTHNPSSLNSATSGTLHIATHLNVIIGHDEGDGFRWAAGGMRAAHECCSLLGTPPATLKSRSFRMPDGRSSPGSAPMYLICWRRWLSTQSDPRRHPSICFCCLIAACLFLWAAVVKTHRLNLHARSALVSVNTLS